MPGGSTTTETGGTTSFTNQPGIKEILGTAGKLFNTGTAWAPDTTLHVTPFAKQTEQGLTGIQNTATGAIPEFMQNFNRVNATLGDKGLNNLQDQQVARLQGLYAQGGGTGLNKNQQAVYSAITPSQSGLTALQKGIFDKLTPTGTGLNAAQTEALNLIRPIAGGGSMAGNPYMEEVIRRTSEDIGNASNLSASAAGRYGSGVHQGVTQDAVGDVSANLRYKNYADEAARRDAAINSLFGMGTTGAGQKSAALGAQGNLATSGANQRAQALGAQGALATQGENQRRDAIESLFGAGREQRANVLAGTKQLSDAYDASLQPYTDQLGVGKAYETKNQQMIDDASRVFDERQAGLKAPVEWLANLANVMRGGQTTTTNTQTTPNNTVGNVLGGALSGYDIFGGPLGGIFGGLAGAFK